MKIVITESLGVSRQVLDELEAPLIREGHTFTEYERETDPEKLTAEVRDADAILLANMPMPEAVLDRCEHLKYVDIAFTGVDHVGMASLRRRGIPASNASGYSTEAVAELGVGMSLSLLRKMRETEERCRNGGTKAGLIGSELMGKTVGIVGLGHIGSRSAELFRAFGCAILASSRTVHPSCPEYISQVTLEELLVRSDIVLLHCPLNDSTRGLIGYERIRRMKKNAVLINLARGPVVNTTELARALREGLIAGAAVDVFDREPPLSAEEPLLTAPGTLLTPHIAFATEESMKLRARIVFENLAAFCRGEIINRV